MQELIQLLKAEIKAMQEKHELNMKILHDRIDALVLEVERLKNA